MTNPLREHLRLSAIEVKRIVLRKHFLLVIAAMFVLSYDRIFWHRGQGDPAGLYGLAATSRMISGMDGLVAGISSAAALAVDTEAGFVGLVLSRNVRRRDYILYKAVATIAVAALATLIRYLWLMGMGAIVLPWDVPGLSGCLVEAIEPTGQINCSIPLPNTLARAPGPFPALFLSHPVLNDVILIVLTALGTGVFALLGLLVAACRGNTYLAIAVPSILPFAIPMVVPDQDLHHWLDPTHVLCVRGDYFCMLPGLEYRLGIWFAYWLGLAIVLIGLSIFVAEKRELALKEHGA
ncbi:MAG: hypothetical protein IPM54_39270 [Polyangiaceae bacterium]|nr:hypothetical protein [Polyangiaceae bacterium]